MVVFLGKESRDIFPIFSLAWDAHICCRRSKVAKEQQMRKMRRQRLLAGRLLCLSGISTILLVMQRYREVRDFCCSEERNALSRTGRSSEVPLRAGEPTPLARFPPYL